LNHLVDSIREKDLFDSGDFLIVVQALEGYCWRFRPQWSKKTLRGKLESICNEFSFIPVIKHEQPNWQIVAESRNYYSHFYHKKPNIQPAAGVALFKITQQLKRILICCVLHQTGFTASKISTIIEAMKK